MNQCNKVFQKEVQARIDHDVKRLETFEKWRDFVIDFGKHKGWTMFQLYVNDCPYIMKFLGNLSDEELNKMQPYLAEAVNGAMTHKNKVDPYSC